MSTAATANAGVPKKGNKKLIIMLAGVLLVLGLGGGGALMLMKKSAPAEDSEDADGEAAVAHKPAKAHDAKSAPTFVPLEPFTVNLADREAERYAQVGITLEVADPHAGDQIKAYMPAIRNNILMALGEKTAAQLMDRDGKTKLAAQVRRETARAMGFDVDEPEADEPDDADSEDAPKGKKKKKKKKSAEALPVTAVHFSNFIIQ